MNDPFTLLPANLGSLADLSANTFSRYSMTGVLLKLSEEGYEACATDGRALGLITGPVTADPLLYPTIPELADAPPSADQALVAGDDWKRAFKAVPRGKVVADQPILGHVAAHLGKDESVLASTDGEKANVVRSRNLEAEFPDYRKVIPQGAPQASVCVNVELLIDLLKVARQVAPAERRDITLEFHGAGKPLVVRSETGEQWFLGLLMPMT
jgi:hypothetical protein